MLCGDLEGWVGGERGREAPEGEDICILHADSCCCVTETKTAL